MRVRAREREREREPTVRAAIPECNGEMRHTVASHRVKVRALASGDGTSDRGPHACGSKDMDYWW